MKNKRDGLTVISPEAPPTSTVTVAVGLESSTTVYIVAYRPLQPATPSSVRAVTVTSRGSLSSTLTVTVAFLSVISFSIFSDSRRVGESDRLIHSVII